MAKFNKIFGIAVAAMFFFLGIYILSPRFSYLPKEIRIIFAVFLFLYGAFRIVRYIFKEKDNDKE